MSRKRTWLSLAIAALALPCLAGVAWSMDFKQSPKLDELTASGKLPPVAERLPENPYVEVMVDGIGKYGGTLRTAILGAGDHYNLTRTLANETLVRWTPDWKDIVPSIAESVDVNDDATAYVFKLRKGMRWSDGAPFTADDIMFWYEDVFMNADLSPTKNAVFVNEGDPVKVEKLDDYTVRFSFTKPYGLFLMQLAYGPGHIPIIHPKHYLKQFHIKYNADGMDKLLAESKTVKDWVSLFNSKVSQTFQPPFWQNTELPTLNPWVLTVPYGDSDRVVAERNPYYWKVDPAGNQLPYIDTVHYSKTDDIQLMLLKITNGELDWTFRHINSVTYRPVLVDGQKSGDYRLFEMEDLAANNATLVFNLNHKDPIKRAIFGNKDFRIAISHAIDREEINDLVWSGVAEISQVGPIEKNELYNERLNNQYLEYDPEKASQLLDGIGLDKRDADGYRLGPDGKRFTILFMVADVFGAGFPDVMLQVQKYCRDIGLDLQIRTTDRARLNTMWYANEHDAYIWNCVGGQNEAYTDVRAFMPFLKADLFYGMHWAEWYADPTTGEEPPPEVKEHMALYDKVKAAPTKETRLAAMKAFLEKTADNFYLIGMCRFTTSYGSIKNNMKGAYEPLPVAGALWHPAPTLVQYYYDK